MLHRFSHRARCALFVLAIFVSVGYSGYAGATAKATVASAVADAIDVSVDEDNGFQPAKIVAHVGEPTTLHLSATGGIHGVASKELGIETTLIRAGHPVDVTFTPEKVGTVNVHCAFVCGVNHGHMQFTVDVQK